MFSNSNPNPNPTPTLLTNIDMWTAGEQDSDTQTDRQTATQAGPLNVRPLSVCLVSNPAPPPHLQRGKVGVQECCTFL